MTTRGELLDEAKGLIEGDRNRQYGPPDIDFTRSAEMLTALFTEKLAEGQRFDAWDIAQIQMVIKLSRLQNTPLKRDHWADIAGYAGCGYETTTNPHCDGEDSSRAEVSVQPTVTPVIVPDRFAALPPSVRATLRNWGSASPRVDAELLANEKAKPQAKTQAKRTDVWAYEPDVAGDDL